LLSTCCTAREEEMWLLESLTAAERAHAGSASQWSAKALLAHIAEWKQQQVQRLEAALREEMPPRFERIDHADARVYERYQQL
jgi:hypothetical protein